MSPKRLTSVKQSISMGLTHLLALSMALPAHGASDLTPFFQASENYTLSYMRYLELKTTAQTDLDNISGAVNELSELARGQQIVVDDFQELADKLGSRIAVIPGLIDSENASIARSQATISTTQRVAAASAYYEDSTEVTKSTLEDKADGFQQKVDEIQTRIDEIQDNIDEQKRDPEYTTLISERNRLELRKDNNLRDVQIRGDENTRLDGQIATERDSLDRWRQIQANKRREKDDIELRQLPPMESELRTQRDDLDELRRQQSSLIFQKERLDGEIELKEIELNAESANLNQAELRLANARERLAEANRILDEAPRLRRERERLTGDRRGGGRDGEGRRGGGDRDRDRRGGGDRDRRGDRGMTIPQAEAIVAEKRTAVNQAQKRIDEHVAIRAGKQGEIDGLNREIGQLDRQIGNINERIGELQRELEQLGNARQEIERLRGQIRQKQTDLRSAEQAVQDQRGVISEREAAVEDLKAQIRPLVAELRELKERGRGGRDRNSEDAEILREGRGNGEGRDREGRDRDRDRDDGEERGKFRKRIREIVQILGVDPTLPKERRKVVNREGLIPQRNRAQKRVNQANERLAELEGNITTINNEIARLQQRIADLGRSGDRKAEIERALEVERGKLSARNSERSGKVERRATLREQRDAAVAQKKNAQDAKRRAERQLAEARQVLSRLNDRLAEIDRQLERVRRVRRNIGSLQDAVQDGQREVSTLGRIVQVLADDLSVLLADSSELQRDIDDQGRRVAALAERVDDLEREIADLRDQLDQAISDLADAIEGQRASEEFIASAEATISENERLIREALAENRQITEDLLPINRDISLFEQTRIHPLQDAKADEEVLRDAELVHVNTLLGWADDWQKAEDQIVTSERVIEQLTEELADLKVEQAEALVLLKEASETLAGTQEQLTLAQAELNKLKQEIRTIESQIEEKQGVLDGIVAQLKEENKDTEPGVIDAVEPVVVDEGFEKISELRQWTAGTVKSHKLWNTPACMAYTTVKDDQDNEVARLEVYAPVADDAGNFAEPIVQVVVSNNSMPILDADLTSLWWNKRRRRLDVSLEATATYLSAKSQNGDLQGLSSRLGDTEEMIGRLRADHTFRVTLNDASGELMELDFSLSGSSATIKKAIEECELKFSELPEVE